MNTNIKTVLALTLIVMMSTGLALAGRGGGHGGAGGHAAGGGHAPGGGHTAAAVHAGGGGGYHAAHAAVIHTPSFSTPHATFNASHFAARNDFRAAVPHEGGGFHPGVTPGVRPEVGPRAETVRTFHEDNRVNTANRRDVHNHTDFANRNYVVNRPNIENNFGVNNRVNNFVRPTHADWNRGGWYHGDWHGHWNNGWYYRPLGWWSGAYWGGAALSAIPWSWGYWPYYNPYYTGPIYDGTATIDYSQPIVVDQPAVAAVATQGGLTAQQQAAPLFDAARAAFMQGDYKTALAQIDRALALVPDDTLLHEFRGQVLFALGRYQEAAAAEYAVLSVGPGWDWTTLSGLYPGVDVYTDQLRALEQFVNLHPSAADARFLLAAQYLTCGYTDAAATQLKAAVQLNPKDQLSAQLLQSLSTPDAVAEAAPGQPAAPPDMGPPETAPPDTVPPAAPGQPGPTAAAPVDAASLVGNWTAKRADGATIKLAVGGDGKFTWTLDQNGKPRQFSGTYSLADNLLVLKQGGNPMMVGQVASLGPDRFNFKLAGDNPSDTGLNFAR